VCFLTCKMHLFMSICNKTANKHNLNGINLNVILKCNLTEHWTQWTSVIMDPFRKLLGICYSES
jgi:hypothetical protein